MKPLPACLVLLIAAVLLIFSVAPANAIIAPTHGVVSSSERALQSFLKTVWKRDAFPYWSHVGKIGRSSGVYLGNGYVLTAAHVGSGTFTLPDGSRYEAVPGSERMFNNHDGTTADLCLFRVRYNKQDRIARLRALPLSTMPPKKGTSLLLLGAGAGSQSKSREGFQWSNEYNLRWGVNSIEEIYSEPMPTNEFASYGFATRFERGLHQCQAAPGDSGGAVFHFNSRTDRWELAGIIVAVDSDFGRAEFGNQTYIADPVLFRRQLAGIMEKNDALLASGY